jgi:hypothetical protein
VVVLDEAGNRVTTSGIMSTETRGGGLDMLTGNASKIYIFDQHLGEDVGQRAASLVIQQWDAEDLVAQRNFRLLGTFVGGMIG